MEEVKLIVKINENFSKSFAKGPSKILMQQRANAQKL